MSDFPGYYTDGEVFGIVFGGVCLGLFISIGFFAIYHYAKDKCEHWKINFCRDLENFA